MTTPNKDREEFCKWFDKNPPKYSPTEIAWDAWQAACANKNAIIDKLTAPPSEGELIKFIYKLRAFAKHDNDCAVESGGKKCSCGYYEILGEQAAITKWLEMRS